MTKEMNATVLQVRRAADLYIATGTPVAASLVISICSQIDDAKESINALTLALETERDAANLYAKQVAHWIGKHDLVQAQYNDLVTQVTKKWPNETLHKTAKRYICNWEGRDVESVAKQEVKP